MNSTHRVTILMPVYNAEKYLAEAIESILNQTYKDFELLIINDGSTDRSEEIIQEFSDIRISYMTNETNIGLIRTLNKGIGLIPSEYIARMDADDISLPTRLEKQIKFMDQHPEIMVSGTSIQFFNDQGNIKDYIVKSDWQEIKTELLFQPALMHPTVIMRKKFISDGNFFYNESHGNAEDYGLWLKISFNNKMSNIQEVLLKYRVNETGISQLARRNPELQDLVHMEIYKQAFTYLGIEVSTTELKAYRLFITNRAIINKTEILVLSRIFNLLRNAIEKKDYNVKIFNHLMAIHYKANCEYNKLKSIQSIRIYRKNFKDSFRYRYIEMAKALLKEYFVK